MTRLNELDYSLGAIERPEYAVNAIAGISEYVPDAPLVQTLDEEITDSLGHEYSSPRSMFDDSRSALSENSGNSFPQ